MACARQRWDEAERRWEWERLNGTHQEATWWAERARCRRAEYEAGVETLDRLRAWWAGLGEAGRARLMARVAGNRDILRALVGLTGEPL